MCGYPDFCHCGLTLYVINISLSYMEYTCYKYKFWNTILVFLIIEH